MKKLIILFVLVSISKGFAQEIRLFSEEAYDGRFTAITRSLNYDEVVGSPYLDEDLLMGYVKFRLGDSAVTYFRYNIYADEMEYLDGEELLAINNAGEVDRIYFNKHTFIFTNYYFRNSLKQGYLEVLTSGTCKLYVKYDVEFKKAESPKSSYDQAKPPTFVRRLPQYYFSCNDQPIKDFENDKDGIAVIGNDYMDELNKYVKDNKLKLRKVEDLKALFEYYNTLLK